MNKAGSGFTQVINVERLGREAIRFKVSASEADLQALAQQLNILAVEDLEAAGSLQRQPKSGLIDLVATVRAIVVQACVVTLEPVPQEIEERIEVAYTFDAGDLAVEEAEYLIGSDELDAPELIVNNEIDVAAMISEHVALALDPYPRSEAGRAEQRETGDLEQELDEEAQEVYKPFANLRDLMNKK